MREFPRGATIAPPNFAVRPWRGYDIGQVDRYLQRLGEHIGRLEARLARLEQPELAALDVLHQAQRIAAETLAEAQCAAEKLRQNAKTGLENARKDAFATLDAARVEADRTLLSAQEQAEAAIERAHSDIAELESAGEARTKEFDTIVEELKGSAVQSAAELRSAGERLVEMAEHFEFRLATGGEMIGDRAQGIIDFDSAPVEVA